MSCPENPQDLYREYLTFCLPFLEKNIGRKYFDALGKIAAGISEC